ncbi:MAG TPA: sulfurtransferase [Thermomicrobiales bacterium]|nr:sulfurtransferase [Thermomicrobiales bacterium]
MSSKSNYANPDALVSTEWVAKHKDDPGIVLAEVNEDILLYESGHIPGAIKLDWTTELQDQTIRDFIDEEGFNRLMSQKGIKPTDTVVFYGDRSNWWAAYAYWFFKYMSHDNVKLMNGGRDKWVAEGRELTREVPEITPTEYTGAKIRPELRAFREDVLEHIGYDGLKKVGEAKPLVDVRSPAEFSGEVTHMPEYPQEGVLRGGHIPGAANIPWAQAVAEDGTFKRADELRELYESKGITPDEDVVVYCRIGERSSHTWFVLHELLGYPKVRNYDGSWTEWGNILRVPVEKGPGNN